MTQLISLDQIKTVKDSPIEEYFTSGHRTCQGCESALIMKLMVMAVGPRTIVLGSTGCMYVANTTYYSTSWVVPSTISLPSWLMENWPLRVRRGVPEPSSTRK